MLRPLSQPLYDTEMLPASMLYRKKDSTQTLLNKWKAFVKSEEDSLKVQAYQAEWDALPSRDIRARKQFRKKLIEAAPYQAELSSKSL